MHQHTNHIPGELRNTLPCQAGLRTGAAYAERAGNARANWDRIAGNDRLPGTDSEPGQMSNRLPASMLRGWC